MRIWKIAAATAVLAGIAALGAGSPSADAKGNLVVKRFLLGRLETNTDRFIATGGRGSTNVFRDNVIQFVFTAPVVPASGIIDTRYFNQRTIKMGVPTGPTLFIDAQGTYSPYVVKAFDAFSGTFQPKRTYRNRVIFDPTSRNEQDASKKNPYGFLEDSTYTVSVPGIDSGETKVVRSVDGRPNLTTFTTSFRTSSAYLQDYIQPHIESVVGVDAPLIPLDGRTNVDSRADIVATFSEPMLPSSFDPATSFRVFNATLGRTVSGTIRTSADGRTFTYRPVFGYGRGPSNVTVTLTTAIADRSGNVLDKGLTLNFSTEYDPFAPNYDELVEPFDTKSFEDSTYPAVFGKANWARPGTQYLEGTFSNANLEILYSNGSLQRAYPWWSGNAVRTQMYHAAAQMGTTPRTIAGFQWHDAYPGTYAGVYPNVVVQVGHNTTGFVDQTGAWAASFSTPPLSVYSGSYSPPLTGEWRSGPTFSTNFLYDGTSNVVLDIDNRTAGNVPNYWRRISNGNRSFYSSLDGPGSAYANDLFDIRWVYLVDKSEAQSKWYDTTRTSPSFLSPIVLTTKPAGTVITVSYQGADASPLPPYGPDLNTATGWVADPENGLASYRFIRFHVDMQSNLSSGAKPIIDSITIPVLYF